MVERSSLEKWKAGILMPFWVPKTGAKGSELGIQVPLADLPDNVVHGRLIERDRDRGIEKTNTDWTDEMIRDNRTAFLSTLLLTSMVYVSFLPSIVLMIVLLTLVLSGTLSSLNEFKARRTVDVSIRRVVKVVDR